MIQLVLQFSLMLLSFPLGGNLSEEERDSGRAGMTTCEQN
jgi:hypothetical protein